MTDFIPLAAIFKDKLTLLGGDVNSVKAQMIVEALSSGGLGQMLAPELEKPATVMDPVTGQPKPATLWGGDIIIDGTPFRTDELARQFAAKIGGYCSWDTPVAKAVSNMTGDLLASAKALLGIPEGQYLTPEESKILSAIDKATDAAVSERFAAGIDGRAFVISQSGLSAASNLQTYELPLAKGMPDYPALSMAATNR